MKVHLNQNSIAAILSFKEVDDIPGVIIATDTKQERAMAVSLRNGKTLKFKECKSGLYFMERKKGEQCRRNK